MKIIASRRIFHKASADKGTQQNAHRASNLKESYPNTGPPTPQETSMMEAIMPVHFSVAAVASGVSKGISSRVGTQLTATKLNRNPANGESHLSHGKNKKGV